LDRPRDRPKRTAAGAAMLALLFTLFAASSTDVLANFFHVSLNEVLWFFRIATFVVPSSSASWYGICLEMQGVHGIGKRKRAVIVQRSAEGEYTTVRRPPRPGPATGTRSSDPEPVPVRIDIEPLGMWRRCWRTAWVAVRPICWPPPRGSRLRSCGTTGDGAGHSGTTRRPACRVGACSVLTVRRPTRVWPYASRSK
jgi:hypothetical protein